MLFHSKQTSKYKTWKKINQQRQQQYLRKKTSVTPSIDTWRCNMAEHHHHDNVFDIYNVFKDHLQIKTSKKDNFDTCSTHSNTSCYRRQHVKHSAISIKNVLILVSHILPICDNGDSVIVFIPGNPGAIEFYDMFIEYLCIECQIPIFGVSYAGMILPFLCKIMYSTLRW